MIVSSHDDTILLRGALHKNEWLTIKALARLLLQQHAQGILIDCTGLTEVSESGAKTFLTAMRDIQSEGARIMVVNLPDNVYEVVRSVPGVRSQLPIAKSLEEARASLRLGKAASRAETSAAAPHSILVPLLPGLDIQYSVIIAGRVAREMKLPITLASFLVVARNMPLGAPMAEQEEAAQTLLEQAAQVAKEHSLPTVRHLERVRDAEEGLLLLIKSSKASHVILSAYADHVHDDAFQKMLEILLHRAPCNVVVARRAPNDQHPLESSSARSMDSFGDG